MQLCIPIIYIHIDKASRVPPRNKYKPQCYLFYKQQSFIFLNISPITIHFTFRRRRRESLDFHLDFTSITTILTVKISIRIFSLEQLIFSMNKNIKNMQTKIISQTKHGEKCAFATSKSKIVHPINVDVLRQKKNRIHLRTACMHL